MTALLDEAHQLVDVGAPVVQDGVVPPWRDKVDQAGGPIDLGVDRLAGDQLGQEGLSPCWGEVEQLGEAGDGDAGVVLADRADVLRARTGTG